MKAPNKYELNASPVFFQPGSGTRPVTAVAVPSENTQSVVIIEKVVEKSPKEISLGGLPLIMGIVFWAHGAQSNDAWFEGEELTGEIITGIYIALIGCLCCVGCCAGVVGVSAKGSENDMTTELEKAEKVLESDNFSTLSV